MNPIRIAIMKVGTVDTALPEYISTGAAGMDLPAAVPDPVVLEAGGFHVVPCGFAMAIPAGFEGGRSARDRVSPAVTASRCSTRPAR